jgi:hypothetical protein
MTANEIQTICNTNPVNVADRRHIVFGSGLTVARPSSFALRATYTRGHTQVHVSGALPPGTYRLKLTEPFQRVGAGAAPKRDDRARHHLGWSGT